MKKIFTIPFLFFFFVTLLFFNSFFFQSKLPIPSDTIIGLYFPYRDLYAKEYPRGLPFKNFQITDPVRQQYPWKLLSVDIIRNNNLPTWNPYSFAGTPLLANFQSAAFYPLNLLFFAIPFSLAWSIFIIIQPVLAMVFMYFYLRHLKLSTGSSLLGSIGFAFCGFFVSWMEWGNVVSTGLWLPLILLSIDKLIQSSLRATKGSAAIQLRLLRRWMLPRNDVLFWSFIFIFSLTSSFLAGHLQTSFYSFLVSFLYFLTRWVQFGKNKKLLFIYLILNTLFLILTAVQWIPTLQFILLSARNLDQNWHNPGWFVPFQNLTQFIAPDFFGNPSTLNYWGVWNYGEFIGYIGFIPLIFALLAIIFNRRKIVWFFTGIFLLSLIFALPTIFAKIPFKFSIPFLSTTQPTRLLYLADIALCILAAFGFEYFLKNKKKIIVPISIIGIFLLSFWSYTFFNPQLPSLMQTDNINLEVTKNNLKLPTLLFAISIFIFTLYFLFEKRFKYTKTLILITILIVTVFDLYRFTSKYITFADSKYLFPNTKILSFLREQKEPFRVIATDSRVFPPNFSIIYKIQTLDGYDPLFTKRYAELSAAIARGKPDITPPFGFNRIITTQRYQSHLVDLLNVKYILSLTEMDPKNYRKIIKEGETTLYENLNVFPRAFFVNKIVAANSKQEAIDALFDKGLNLKLVGVVEKYPKNEESKKFTKGKVIKIDYTENKVVIYTKNNGEGFLILSDSFYPTWHAKVCSKNKTDCKETKIYLTNYNFRGVIVPSGNHSVIFYNTLL